jgi:membrane-associated phospholipid phosphatase
VSDLPFHQDWMQWLADHRVAPVTAVMQGFTWTGELEGMVLLVALVYAVWDKQLAIRLATVALVAMTANHFLKTLIRNPRPFVAAGTYREHWIASPQRASELVAEFSTPSGHAMTGAAFWGTLFAHVQVRWAKVLCVVAILGTGLSRPYLGVHYVEDVLLGWPLGVAIAWLTVRFGGALGARWRALALGRRVAIAVIASAALWSMTRAFGGAGVTGQPNAFLSYAGFLTGIVVAEPLEARLIRYDPRSSSVARKALRFALGVALVLGPLALLDRPFAAIAADATPLGDALRYLRYAVASLAGLFVAPLLWVRLGLAERLRTA